MLTTKILRKTAFTMLELIIVIVVVGIISIVMIPKTDTDPARDAANQVSRHLQYAQHLAMVDDVFNDQNASWPGDRWGLLLGSSGKYTVQTGKGRYALDPLTKVNLDGTGITDLGRKFSVSSITINCGGSAAGAIVFDNIGRPYQLGSSWGATSATAGRLNNTNCLVTVTGENESADFTLNGETGYIGDVTVH